LLGEFGFMASVTAGDHRDLRARLTIIVVATRQTPVTRAKDSDRNDTCQILDSALADGQLSMEEHRTRVALATGAETLGDLQSLTSDLQTGNAPVHSPNKSPSKLWAQPNLTKRPTVPGSGWGMRAAVAGVLVVLGIAIGWGLYGNTPSPLSFTSDPGAKSDGIPAVVLTPPRQLHSLGGLNGLIEQMRKKFGDTNGYRLIVYPDYVSLDRPDPQDDRRQLTYTYRGGWGDPTTSAKSDDDRLVDVAKFDVKAVVGVLRGAPETLGMKPTDVESTYLTIDPSRDPTTPDAVSIDVYVSSDFGSGYIQLAPDGTVKQINYPNS
jgi:hypothetical protein